MNPAEATSDTSTNTTAATPTTTAAACTRLTSPRLARSAVGKWMPLNSRIAPNLVEGPGAADQQRHRFGVVELGRRDECELVVEVARVLDHANHRPGSAVEVDNVADRHCRVAATPVGDRHLACVIG